MIDRDKYIGFYKEFFPNRKGDPFFDSLPKLVDNLSNKEMTCKGQIVEYLRTGGEVELVGSGTVTDVFTGAALQIPSRTRQDGVYEWSEKLAYYVDRYNLRLPDEFVSHILRNCGPADAPSRESSK